MSAHGVSDSFIHRVLGVITSAIYSFHMPLFMALSGALFSRNKMRGFLPFVKSKAQRLLLPFVVVASFVSVPLKYFAGYWDGSENILRDVFVGQYLIQGNTHLWFLVTLFCEFVIFTSSKNIVSDGNQNVLFFCFCLRLMLQRGKSISFFCVMFCHFPYGFTRDFCLRKYGRTLMGKFQP